MNDRTRPSRARLAALTVAGLLVLAPAAVMAQSVRLAGAGRDDPGQPLRRDGRCARQRGRQEDRLHLARRAGALRGARLERYQGAGQGRRRGARLLRLQAGYRRQPSPARSSSRSRASRASSTSTWTQKASPNICAAYNNVPTIAIDIIQPPCQVAFMGANNHEAGRIARCEAREVRQGHVELRLHGVRLAGIHRRQGRQRRPNGRLPRRLQGILPDSSTRRSSRTSTARTRRSSTMADVFTATPGDRIIVVGINEDGVIGALGCRQDPRPGEGCLRRRPGR